MTDNNATVINQSNSPIMTKLMEITERLARVEEKVVSSSDIERAVDKLEDKMDIRVSLIENDVKSINQSIHFMEKSVVPKTPIALKITAFSAIIAIIIGAFTITGMINDNTRSQAKIQYLENQVEDNKTSLNNTNK